ncbi:hypothetical protein F5Y04DRAFT_212426 [Hypomontagnella monticulosa]|nr:hypothetical protein F5Y04DRAFT_212426 [Hypomontagnella monticulosa]
MRLCKALRHSSANLGRYKKLTPRYNRRFSVNGRTRRDDVSQASAKANTTGEPHTSDRDDAFTIDSESKTIETAVGDLPLSPVMDPTFWEARRQHQVPKAKPGKPQNSVERQLRANPFAKALATSVRMCTITRNRLPAFFLQDFNLVAHPETGDPWLIPNSILPDDPSTTKRAGAETPKSQNRIGSGDIEPGVETVEVELNDIEVQDQSTTDTTATETSNPQGPGAYVLARQDLLSSIGVPKTSFAQAYKRIAERQERPSSVTNKVVWRKDMDNYILTQLRENVKEELLYLCRLCAEDARHYIVKCYGWDDVQFKHKGSVLWFGEPEESVSAGLPSNEPGPFAVFDFQQKDIQGQPIKTGVVVHNMPMLLGSELADSVKEEGAALRDGSIFMLAGRRTVNLQMKLWKLQGYLADYIDFT